MSEGKKTDKNETFKRVRAIQEWILQGQRTCDIITQVCVLWDVGERQAYKLFNKAWTELQDLSKRSLEERKSLHIEMRLKLFRDLKYKESPNGARAALRIADSIARIDGVIPIRENQSGFGGDLGDDEESDGAIMKLADGTEIEI